ncbi:MAG TPA: flagellar hook-basal body complex protein, partial [Acidimicrobiales bacterium]|nr:flagellar hook-basal body complex protein [Acidimicrobiales bacterium]
MADQATLAAVSGIDANQTYLDAVANNIANADTVGYKSQDVEFQDLLTAQLSGAAAPPTSGGAGIDPLSLGSGVRIGSESTDLSEGSLEETGQSTDLAIQGNGYLVSVNNGLTGYTRDGSLTIDADGDLATTTGGLIQGWQANGAGVIDNNAPVAPIKIPTGESIPAQATTTLTLGGNLPAWDGNGTAPVVTTTLDAYDSLGDAIPVTLTFTGVAGTANEWTMTGSVTSPTGTVEQLWATGPTVTFDPTTGEVKTVTGSTTGSDGSLNVAVGTMPAGFTFPTGDTWNISFPPPTSSSAVTQFAGEQSVALESQDGHASGSLESFSIG